MAQAHRYLYLILILCGMLLLPVYINLRMPMIDAHAYIHTIRDDEATVALQHTTTTRAPSLPVVTSSPPSQGGNESLFLPSTQYYYLHIPKTGGYTMQGLLSSNGAWVYQGGIRPETHRLHKLYKSNPKRRIFMTEGSGFSEYPVNHSLTMFRDPIAHVVSQYFHCLESDDHKHRRYAIQNVTLDQWLEYWAEQKADINVTKYGSKFQCYTPINTHSRLVGWEGTKEDLKTKFEVIGTLEHLERTKCLMLIHTLGKVQESCDCTHNRRRHLNSDHGVTHHGSSYPLSDHQRQLILMLTDQDQIMYQMGIELMEETGRTLEERYSVRICG